MVWYLTDLYWRTYEVGMHSPPVAAWRHAPADDASAARSHCGVEDSKGRYPRTRVPTALVWNIDKLVPRPASEFTTLIFKFGSIHGIESERKERKTLVDKNQT